MGCSADPSETLLQPTNQHGRCQGEMSLKENDPEVCGQQPHEAVPPLEALRDARKRLLGAYGVCAADAPELVLEMAMRATTPLPSPDNPESE